MEIGLRVPLKAEVDRPGEAVLPARLLLDVARSLPADERHARAAQRRAGRRADLRRRDLPPAHAARRGLPDAARRRRPRHASRCPPARSSTTISRVARSASRDETRPVLTGILDVRLRPGAAHGRDRLLPPERQGDRAARRRCRAASRRTCPARALQELARIAQQRRAELARRQRRAEPGRLRARRHRALLAADRRPVPELPPAAARDRRARAAPGERRADRRRAAHQPARAEERAAAAQLQRGRRSPSRRRRPTSARPARRCRCRSTASRSRSASTPSSCATASRASSPTSWC